MGTRAEKKADSRMSCLGNCEGIVTGLLKGGGWDGTWLFRAWGGGEKKDSYRRRKCLLWELVLCHMCRLISGGRGLECNVCGKRLAECEKAKGVGGSVKGGGWDWFCSVPPWLPIASAKREGERKGDNVWGEVIFHQREKGGEQTSKQKKGVVERERNPMAKRQGAATISQPSLEPCWGDHSNRTLAPQRLSVNQLHAN